MKFLCKEEFMHSGDRIYTAGTVYEITEETAHRLVMIDKQHEGGALRFFTPVDEAAAECMKAIHGTKPEPEGKIVSNADGKGLDKAPASVAPPADTTAPPAQPAQPPSRDTLMKEAKSLGLKVPFGTSNNDLMMLITAARQRLPTQE
jgi:hypothetical protein